MTYVAAAYLTVMLLFAAYAWTLWARHRELVALLSSHRDVPSSGGAHHTP